MVLIGTLGYHNLKDFSLGPILFPIMQEMDWPDEVEIDELNWGAVAIVQNFQARTEPYDRVVILSATPRDRPIGTLTYYHWQGGIPSLESIQDRISEAVTGVTSLDNLLVIGEYFDIWPTETLIVDVEPHPEQAGERLTDALQARIPEVLKAVEHAALADWSAIKPKEILEGKQFELYP